MSAWPSAVPLSLKVMSVSVKASVPVETLKSRITRPRPPAPWALLSTPVEAAGPLRVKTRLRLGVTVPVMVTSSLAVPLTLVMVPPTAPTVAPVRRT